ncbi:hypothetical protein PSCICL_13080 [Pseudomonas cichorii]|nr:hypothetical protein [Pseudomonas cichorii]GFM59954.1 hypothetical protein PSCICG_11140 [Pseudomonas cichorii]GFM70316.1 hypothetical protein PSCICL_13080 [Pseudomonas cichorii]
MCKSWLNGLNDVKELVASVVRYKKVALFWGADDDVLAIAAIAMAKVGFFKISDFSLRYMFF